MVEHRPFKAIVDGSSPSALYILVNFIPQKYPWYKFTMWPHRLAWSRTTDFRFRTGVQIPMGSFLKQKSHVIQDTSWLFNLTKINILHYLIFKLNIRFSMQQKKLLKN